MMVTEDREDKTVSGKTFTDDEAALYDRQIRLWGVDAQKRLNSAHILIIGLGGIGAEVSKNIILGGVKSVTLMDDEVVTVLDSSSQFLVGCESIGQNRAEASLSRAQQLNPMVEVTADKSSTQEKSDDFYAKFTVIVATNCSKNEMVRLNRIARQQGVKFFASDVFGFFGYMFSDLGEHKYKREIVTPQPNNKPDKTKVIDGVSYFMPLQDVFSIDFSLPEFAPRVKKTNAGVFTFFVLLEFFEQHKRKPTNSASDIEELLKLRNGFAQKNGISSELIDDANFTNVYGALSPVCAITGGILAQEVVKAISHKDCPLVNLFVYNPVAGSGFVENFVDS